MLQKIDGDNYPEGIPLIYETYLRAGRSSQEESILERKKDVAAIESGGGTDLRWMPIGPALEASGLVPVLCRGRPRPALALPPAARPRRRRQLPRA
jgi:hypothetical protein